MHFIIAVLLLVNWLVAGDFHVEPLPIGPKPLHLGHDSDWALFSSAVAAMRRSAPDARVVIISGDLLSHHFPNDAPLARRTMARIVQTFNAAFPRAQFVIVMGNNDDPCGDYRTTPGTPYYRYLAHLWAPLVNRRGAAPNFERDFARYGWYSARLPLNNVRIMAANSVYWSFLYRGCSAARTNLADRELQWLERSFAQMPAGERAIVVMHIPPGGDASSTLAAHRFLAVPFLQQRIETSLIQTLERYETRVPLVLAGHVHRSDFRVFGHVPLLIAPSISPSYYNNPAFLRLDVSADGTLRDYTPFYYSFDSHNWRGDNNFDRAYGVSSFSARALAFIHARLAVDDELRALWAQTTVSESPYRDVNSRTWRVYWCAQTQLGGGFEDCTGTRRRVQIATACLVAGAIAAALAIALVRRRSRRVRPKPYGAGNTE